MTLMMPRHLFTVDDFYRMAEAGILHPDQRLDLIEGEIVERAPIGSRHAEVVDRLAALLIRGLKPPEARVRVQGPLMLDKSSELQPDIAILLPRSYAARHPGPRDVALLIEVADSTLLSDQQVKVPLYARHGIPEVWIVNLTNESIEIYSDPSESGYTNKRIVARSESASPIAFPSLVLSGKDILGKLNA